MKADYLRHIRKAPSYGGIVRKHAIGDFQTYPFGKDDYCMLPYRSALIAKSGSTFVCTCHGHLPYPVCNIMELNSIEELWERPVAKILQKSTSAGGSFKFCNTKKCGGPVTCLETDSNQKYEFILAIDDTCNLQCPSCRTELRHLTAGAEFDQREQYAKHFMDMLSKFDHSSLIEIGGDGEPFVSKIYSDIIYNYIPNNKHKFRIRTNATLLNQRNFLESKVIKQVKSFTISIDAGSEEVYKKVRYPGNWNHVINSLDFLKENNFKFSLNFVVQKNNFRDLLNFVNLCQHYQCIGHITAVEDWGSWGWGSNSSFEDQAVFLKNHTFFNECKTILDKVKEHSWNSSLYIKGILNNL